MTTASLRADGGRLEIDDIHKAFGSVQAIRGVSLDIPAGYFMTLLGPSGCGKTTTLNVLAGLEKADAGSIRIDGVDITQHAPHERGMAMVFQSYALYPHKNVFGNLSFALKLSKVPRSEIDVRVRRVAEMLEIGSLLGRRVGELSGGQQQRVSLARALVKEPRVFLFDEPLSNLDASLRIKTRNEIKLLHQRLGTTSVFVTHDQEEAMALSDIIAVMNNGLVEHLGTPDEIYHRPRNMFVASFVGNPKMNLLEGSLGVENGATLFTTSDGSARFELPSVGSLIDPNAATGANYAIGVRSESVSIAPTSDPSSTPATVQLVEPMGSDTFLSLEVGTSLMTVRVPAADRPKPGDTCHIRLSPREIHLFDAASGQRCNLDDQETSSR